MQGIWPLWDNQEKKIWTNVVKNVTFAQLVRTKNDIVVESPNPPNRRRNNNCKVTRFLFGNIPWIKPKTPMLIRRKRRTRNITPNTDKNPNLLGSITIKENMRGRFNITVARRTRYQSLLLGIFLGFYFIFVNNNFWSFGRLIYGVWTQLTHTQTR